MPRNNWTCWECGGEGYQPRFETKDREAADVRILKRCDAHTGLAERIAARKKKRERPKKAMHLVAFGTWTNADPKHARCRAWQADNFTDEPRKVTCKGCKKHMKADGIKLR